MKSEKEIQRETIEEQIAVFFASGKQIEEVPNTLDDDLYKRHQRPILINHILRYHYD